MSCVVTVHVILDSDKLLHSLLILVHNVLLIWTETSSKPYFNGISLVQYDTKRDVMYEFS